ncbi:MAG: tetratricopeptide repeat protein [Acidobacteriaceae bacterium]|nr:tetratricopeptide repeat protein [Acidobacteriaceae bacterium]
MPLLRISLALLACVAVSLAAQASPSGSNDPQLVEASRQAAAGSLHEAEQTLRHFLSAHENSADGHELLGYVLFKENEPKLSLTEYNSAASLRPLQPSQFEVMGCDYFLLEDYASADEWLTKSIDLGNKNALVFYLLGRTKYNERRFEEAAHLFTESLALDPRNLKAQTNLGHAYEELGRTEDALAAYKGAVALESDSKAGDAEPYEALGALLTEEGRPAEALPFLIKAAELASDRAWVQRELGKTYLALKEPGQARAALETAVNLDPQNGPSHFLLGQAYQKLGMAGEARRERDRYRELGDNHSIPDDPLSEARSLVQAGKLAQAEEATRSYLDLHKNSADAHYLLGYILFKRLNAKGSLAEYTEAARYRRPTAKDLEVVAGDYVLLHDYPDADKWFTQSLSWDPTNWQALYYLGRTKYNENRFDEAVTIFLKCLQSEPKSVKAEDNLGLSLEALGRTEEAIAAYRNAISWESVSSAPDFGPYLDLGALLVTNDRSPEALTYLERALAIAPQEVRVHRELGKAFLHLDRLQEAQAELQKSIALAPDEAPTHFILAQVYRKRGLAEKARLEFQRYTALAASHSTDDSR